MKRALAASESDVTAVYVLARAVMVQSHHTLAKCNMEAHEGLALAGPLGCPHEQGYGADPNMMRAFAAMVRKQKQLCIRRDPPILS